MKLSDIKLGIYEKALPTTADWAEKLEMAKRLGFQFIEISVDESDARLARLKWTREERRDFRNLVFDSGLTVPSMCFSGHRRYPLGSHDPAIREKSRIMMDQAISLAVDLGIRTIQLAGYDVYYEEGDEKTRQWFIQGLQQAVKTASRENVMLSMEIMDTKYMSSITRYLNLKKKINSPWMTVYPDLGNLTAWGNDVAQELELGIDQIAAIHLKDTLKVTPDFPGKFRDTTFGTGCVDFTDAFSILRRLDYCGPFLIEMWTEKADNPEQEIANARQWMIERMKEGEYIDE